MFSADCPRLLPPQCASYIYTYSWLLCQTSSTYSGTEYHRCYSSRIILLKPDPMRGSVNQVITNLDSCRLVAEGEGNYRFHVSFANLAIALHHTHKPYDIHIEFTRTQLLMVSDMINSQLHYIHSLWTITLQRVWLLKMPYMA